MKAKELIATLQGLDPELAQNPNGNFTVLNGIGLEKSFQTDHQFIQDLGTFNDRV